MNRSEPVFSCFPAFQGLRVCSPDHTTDRYLPVNARSTDRVLAQPKLAFELTAEEYDELTLEARPVAITAYGAKNQDKASNQDFALSALIRDLRGEPWSFAAVADGVSTKTFWPERASRLACLAAFRVARSWIRNGSLQSFEALEQLPLRAELAQALHRSLEADRQWLQQFPDVCASGFTREHYRSRQHQNELWYNTTLLVGLLGPGFGLVIHAGDGGIRLVRDGAEKTVLETSAGLQIDTFVSLGVTGSQFKLARFRYEGSRQVRLYLASDGIDRTLYQRQRQAYQTLRLETRNAGCTTVQDLTEQKPSELDNASVVLMCWPPAAYPSALPPALPPPPEPQPVYPTELPTPEAPPPEPPPPTDRNQDPRSPPPTRELPGPAADRSPRPPLSSRQGLLVIVVAALVAMGILAWLLWLLLGMPTDSERHGNGKRDPPDAGAGPGPDKKRPTAPPPAPTPGQLPVKAETSWQPSGGLFLVITPENDTTKQSRQAVSRALLEAAASWGVQIADLHVQDPDRHFAVVAFADQTGSCSNNQNKAATRAKDFRDFIVQIRPELKEILEAQPCGCVSTPGIHDALSPEARRLALYAGPREPAFTCPPGK